MKFSLFKNDKSTYWDEIILCLMIAISVLLGTMLIVFKPSIWLISKEISVVTGVMLILFGVMFIPGTIYRFFDNNHKK